MAVALVRRVLVVDDEKHMRGLLREILVPAGFDVSEADDGQRALESLVQQPVDLIIADRAMPIMDGLELLKILKERKSKIPVIMISAFGEEDLWGKAIGLGAVDYLVKPFKADDVLSIVRKHLPSGKTR